jgi:hypothetical protein
MEIDYLSYWLAAWPVFFALIFWLMWKKKAGAGAGLVLAYLLNLWLIHWVAAALYVIPGYAFYEPEVVAIGLKQSTIAAGAFCLGSVVLAPLLFSVIRFPAESNTKRLPDLNLPKVYILVGALCYVVLLPLLGGLPTITALVSSGWNLTVVGLILKCWDAWRKGKRKAFIRWVVFSAGLPFLTVITQGFIGFGTFALILVLSFVYVIYRPRWKVMVISLVIAYFGLSLYVTYMRDRSAIRDVVWGGESYQSRADRMIDTFTNVELFDPANEDHLRRIDDRLNQSVLVGEVVQYINTGQQDYAYGATFWQALQALIPRIIWPDKPVAGSGNLVHQYTGISFDSTTSVGVGQVMEFYINFGTTGIVCGFLVMGLLVALFDKAAGIRLLEGDWQSFALWFLPGLALLQVGGSMVEVTASVWASLVLALLIKRYILARLQGKKLPSLPAQMRSDIAVLAGRRHSKPNA